MVPAARCAALGSDRISANCSSTNASREPSAGTSLASRSSIMVRREASGRLARYFASMSYGSITPWRKPENSTSPELLVRVVCARFGTCLYWVRSEQLMPLAG